MEFLVCPDDYVPAKRNVKLSKKMSYLLRHGAKKAGLDMDSAGWVKLSDLKRRVTSGVSDREIKDIVWSCNKQRFALASRGKVLYIRANQGHSIPVPDLDLRPVTSSADLPNGIAIHGTTKTAWGAIKQKGLDKMGRNHIHLACGLPGADGVISGMRARSQVLIYVDVDEAIAAGIPFYLSANDVILSGPTIPPQFLRAEFR